MRVFLAIDINESVKREMENIIKKLKRLGANARWVRPDNAHITIKFFGEISESEIELIMEKIKEGIADIIDFNIAVEKLGVFPEYGKNPRVVWAGVRVGKELEKLYNELNKRFSKIGFPEEHKEFKPHLTLCRIKNSSGLSGLKKGIAENENHSFGEISVDNIILYKSELTSNGPVYSIIRKFSFGEKV
jgi:2'-5' RNA ligase